MFDLYSYHLDELFELRSAVEARIREEQEALKAVALKEIQAIADEHGIPLDELIDTGRRTRSGNGQKKPRNHGEPKYRSPFNHDQVWTGKGKRPGWFVAAQASGMTPEQMLI